MMLLQLEALRSTDHYAVIHSFFFLLLVIKKQAHLDNPVTIISYQTNPEDRQQIQSL
jgi:hypothetical protein